MSVAFNQKFFLLIIFMAIASFYNEGFAKSSRAKPTETSPGEDSLFSTPNPLGHPEFVNLVNNAKDSINLVMFHLSDQDDINALIKAKQRGINVRVLLNHGTMNTQYFSTESLGVLDVPVASSANVTKVAAYEQLKSAGVDVKLSSAGFSITHEKSMTVDNQTTMISTVNLTNLYKITRDFGIILNDDQVLKEFNLIFEADWLNADQGTTTTPALTVDRLVWSPNNSTDKIISLLNSAKSSIEIYVETIDEKDILQAIESAAHRGVAVRILAPLCVEGFNRLFNIPALQELASKGVQAKVMPAKASATQPYIHAKAIIVDGVDFYLGSTNLTYNSLHKAREVGLIVNGNNQLAHNMINTFDQDWAQALNIPTNTANACGSGG